jgi:hypothetical protein
MVDDAMSSRRVVAASSLAVIFKSDDKLRSIGLAFLVDLPLYQRDKIIHIVLRHCARCACADSLVIYAGLV